MPLPNMREPRPGQVTRLAEGPATDTQSTTWRREAYAVIKVLANTGAPFHCDDLAMLAGDPPNIKQLGACLAAAQRQRLITVVGAAIVDGRVVRVFRAVTP